jgi:hypothetical protein
MITQEVKFEFGIAITSWFFLILSKVANLLPEFQAVAVLLAILSSFITILINLPKLVFIIKKLFR